MGANCREFFCGGMLRVCRRRRSSVALEAARENSRGFIFAQASRVQKELFRIPREIAVRCNFSNRKTPKREMTQGALGVIEEHAVSVSDPDDPGEPMLALQFCGAYQNFEFAGSLPRRVSR